MASESPRDTEPLLTSTDDCVEQPLPDISVTSEAPDGTTTSLRNPNEINLGDNGLSEAEHQRKVARNTIYGMVLVAIGTGFICTVGAIAKNHGGSVLELLLGRYVLQNFISWLIWVFKRPKVEAARHWYGDSPYKMNIWLRGALYWSMIFCWWRGLELVPIGDAEAILFLSPLTTVIAARIYLKESLPKVFALTFFLSIIGVTFICQPAFVFGATPGTDYDTISWQGLLFLMGAVLSWSAVCILVRTAKEAHWLQLELVSSLQSAFIWTPLLIFLNRVWWKSDGIAGGDWIFDWDTLGVVAIMSILGFLGLMCSVIGYQIGDATKVAWMEYLDLVFAFIYQWFAFNDEPNTWEFIGCGILFSICFVHLLEEGWNFWQRRRERIKLELMAERDALMLQETSVFKKDDPNIKNEQKLNKLHPLDRTPREEPGSHRDQFRSFMDRLTSFSTIRQDSEYQSL